MVGGTALHRSQGELSDPFNLSLSAIMRIFSSTFHSWTFGTETRLAVASYRNYSEIMRIKMEKSSVPLLIFVFPTPASGFVGGQSLSSRYPLKPQGSIISEKRVGKLIVRLIIAEITKGITVISLAQTIWMLYTVLTRPNYTFCKDFSLSDI